MQKEGVIRDRIYEKEEEVKESEQMFHELCTTNVQVQRGWVP